MNKVDIFKNKQFGEIRIVTNKNNEPLFCLADVRAAIGIKDISRCASRLDDDLRQTHPIQDRLGRTQQATFVTESGLYRKRNQETSGLYDLACKLFESSYEKLMEAWGKSAKRTERSRNLNKRQRLLS